VSAVFGRALGFPVGVGFARTDRRGLERSARLLWAGLWDYDRRVAVDHLPVPRSSHFGRTLASPTDVSPPDYLNAAIRFRVEGSRLAQAYGYHCRYSSRQALEAREGRDATQDHGFKRRC
jgi:hypothetical protein